MQAVNATDVLTFPHILDILRVLFISSGTSEDHAIPKLVEGLRGIHIVQVECGSEDAHTLALDDAGKVWSWGDGEYGKLGRGGADSCKVPKLVTDWGSAGSTPVHIVKIFCGSQVSLALTRDGKLYSW